jgi:hypothetical protein
MGTMAAITIQVAPDQGGNTAQRFFIECSLRARATVSAGIHLSAGDHLRFRGMMILRRILGIRCSDVKRSGQP